MNSLSSRLLAVGVVLICGACAHPITIAPDLEKMTADKEQPRIEKSVGYFISEQNRALRVSTPAGGGDSVEYAPYADLEPGIYRVLSNVFSAVHVLKDPKDQVFLESKNIALIFTPTLTTSSSSRNNFFWPPSDFSITIDCRAADAEQREVWKTTVKGEGELIAMKEILKDHGLAGKSASGNALRLLQKELQSAPAFRE